MHIESLQDAVEAEVAFGQRGMQPVWFIWQGKRRLIREVTGAWSERDGLFLHRHFTVSDGEALYELRFDTRALRWWLVRVAVEG